MQDLAAFKKKFGKIGLDRKDLAGGIPIRVVKNKYGDDIEVPLQFSKDGKLVRQLRHHFGPFLTLFSQLYTAPHAPCDVLYSMSMHRSAMTVTAL